MAQKESKEDRFKRVAEKRVQNILKSIQNLSQLTNKKAYQWNEEQLSTIWSAIEDELAKCKDRFYNPDSMNFKL